MRKVFRLFLLSFTVFVFLCPKTIFGEDKYCPDCGFPMDYEVMVGPSCTAEGVGRYLCSSCGTVIKENIPMTAHSYVLTDSKEPTCLEAGYANYACSTCETLYSQNIPALGHSYVTTVNTAASCTEGGSETHTCSRCGDTYTSQTAALGHSYAPLVTKEANCEEEGIRTFTCSRCKDSYEEVISALGHDFNEEKKEASCKEEGYIKKVCKLCGKEEKEIIPILEHEYEKEWTIEKEPGLFSNGLETNKCKRCGEKISRILPAKIPLPILGGILGGVVLIGLGAVLWFKKKAAKKNLKENISLKPSFETKTLLLCSKDEELIDYLKRIVFLEIKEASSEKLKEKAEDIEPHLLIIDIPNDRYFEEILKAKEDYLKDIPLGLICSEGFKAPSDKLSEMKRNGKITGFVKSEESRFAKAIELILPVLKPDIKSDESLSNIGMVADAFGIPGISKIIDTFIAGRDIKITLEEEELGISEDATIIGDIAAILGLEKLESVAGLVGDIEDIQAALAKETGAYEEREGFKAIKDMGETLSDIGK